MPELGDRCQVWWADPVLASEGHLALLDDHERGRRERLRQRADRDRFVTGVALVRLVVAAHLGRDPRQIVLDRSCDHCGEPHGKPRVSEPGGLEVSVSHSGARVAVAVARDHPVGVDVERVDRALDIDAMAGQSLSPEERHELAAASESARLDQFYARWARKEAVLKATGDGLRVPLTDLTVSLAATPFAVRHWHGRPDLVERIQVIDLQPGPDYVASLAALDAPALDVVELSGEGLVRSRQ